MTNQEPDTNSNDKTLEAISLDWTREVNLGEVDRYAIIKRLGSGGFGAVLLARDTVANILVALKVLPPEIAAVPDELENVRANFALVSRLRYHNIAGLLYLHRIEHVDEIAAELLKASSGSYLVVMEYIEGITLSEWQKQFPDKKVPFKQAVHIVRQVAGALDYAHKQRIIHRDIKPANIMVQADDTVKVLDFGIAYEIHSSMSRVTMEKGKTSAGTPNYMSPEQWAGNKLTERCDQYALACMFYEFISGNVPFASAFSTHDYQLVISVITNKECELLDELTSAQNAAIRKAMSKDPKKRFESCTEFIDTLQGVKSHPYKNIWSKVAIVFVLLVTVAVAFWFLRDKDKMQQESSSLGHATADKTGEPQKTPSQKPQTEVEKTVDKITQVTAVRAAVRKRAIVRTRPVPGYDWTIPNSGNVKMIWIRSGGIRVIEKEQNILYVGNPSGFWFSQTEVTVGQFLVFLQRTGTTAGINWDNPRCPVKMEDNKPVLNNKIPGNSLNKPMTCITPRGVILYCIWLNRRERNTGRMPLRHQYHLPGLDLFKYAFWFDGKSRRIKIGEADKLLTGRYCWNKANSKGMPHDVATAAPNHAGLYDLAGNVYEISVDVQTPSANSTEQQRSGVKYVLFGTSWNKKLPNYKGLFTNYSKDKAGPEVGFRIAMGIMP